MGDSITSPDAWPEELELDKGDWEIDNYGVGGRTVGPRNGRNYRSTKAYKNALKEGFHVLIINLGTNDAQYDLGRAAACACKLAARRSARPGTRAAGPGTRP